MSAKDKDNVIPFKKRIKVSKEDDLLKTGKLGGDNVVDMTNRRQEMIATERRLVTRTVLSQFVGVFVVLPKSGLQPVSLYDISETGLAFDLPQDSGISRSARA